MSKSIAIAASWVVCAAMVAHAQASRTPAALPAQADMQKLQAAMVAAQARSIRPGDEALGCEALQKELMSMMGDPSIQAYSAKANAAAAKELSSREKTRGALTPEAAAARSAALAPAMMAPALAQMNQLVTIMPVLMRSQRVTQLAVAKSCVWATGTALSPGFVPSR